MAAGGESGQSQRPGFFRRIEEAVIGGGGDEVLLIGVALDCADEGEAGGCASMQGDRLIGIDYRCAQSQSRDSIGDKEGAGDRAAA